MTPADARTWLIALHLMPTLPTQALAAWTAHFPAPGSDAVNLTEALRLAYPHASTSLHAVGTMLTDPAAADWAAVQAEMTALQQSRAPHALRPFAYTACTACHAPCTTGHLLSLTLPTAPGLIGGLLQARRLEHPQAMRDAAQHLVNLNLPEAARLHVSTEVAGQLASCLLAHCLGDDLRAAHTPVLATLAQQFRDAP